MSAREQRAREIEVLVRARYPIIYVVSWEERRVFDTLAEVAKRRGKALHYWSATNGLSAGPGMPSDGSTRDPVVALDRVLKSSESAVYAFYDLHPYFAEASVVRKLRDVSLALKATYKTVILVSPVLKIPSELEKEITVIEFGLPDRGELDGILQRIISSMDKVHQETFTPSPEERERVVQAAVGLTAMEAENVFAKSLIERNRFSLEVIVSEKEQVIRKSGLVDYYHSNEQFADIGGLDVLKAWLNKRALAFSERARDFGLPEPKGILLVGVQGCGKSLCAKAVAGLWKLPLLRLDVGRLFAGLVGSSEENMRTAIRVAESVSPAILWIDEIEKGFSGVQSSSGSDGGTAARVFASFLTWLQEKTSPVFVIATANDISSLPPELLRKGRLDEIFFVDLPSAEERKEILQIHLRKRRREFGEDELAMLAKASAGFSGAEIEQAIIAALYDAFEMDQELTAEHVRDALGRTVPLSQMMREQIEQLRNWAVTRAVAASGAAQESTAGRERSLEW